MQVLGILGALDPHVHKRNQQSLQGGLGEGDHAVVSDVPRQIHSMEELFLEIWPAGGLFMTSDDYFYTVISDSIGFFLSPKLVKLNYLKNNHSAGCNTCINADSKGSSVKLSPESCGISDVYI